MSTTERKKCREAIRRLLAHRAGVAPDAGRVAEAALGIWQQVADRLAPVIGVQGVAILFSRALHLTRTDFPWLALAGGHVESAAQLASLKARLAERDPDDATAASYSLLVNVIEILATLLGESLTERLLEPVWVSTPPSAAKETLS